MVLLLYLSALLYVLLFAERNVRGLNGYNIQLLAEIQRYIKYREVLGLKLVTQNLFGNVVGFLPLGFLLPHINNQYKKMLKTVCVVAMFSLGIEFIQLCLRVGCFDVDDVLLNTLGGLGGYGLWMVCGVIRKKYECKKTTKEI